MWNSWAGRTGNPFLEGMNFFPDLFWDHQNIGSAKFPDLFGQLFI